MFDQLTDTLGGAISRLTSRGKLTAGNMDEGLREVRKALLEADVSIAVVREFMERVKTKAVGQLKVKGVDPGQQVVKVVHDELTALMGPIDTRIRESEQPGEPTIIMMIGLQGSGKTTTCGKLSKYLVEKKKKKPLLVAADLQRPAAIDQLKVLGESLDIPVYSEKPGEKKKRGLTGLFKREISPADVCKAGLEHAKQTGRNVVILDTAGRLHIDEDLMKELQDVRKACKPHNVFLVCDAMTGQDAVNSAKQFNDEMDIDGVILTKMDGDARGGAALSVKAVTGKTIKFVGTGEKLDKLEEFHPERMAGRILDMGDVVSLVEKAQEVVDQKQAEKSATRLMTGRFNFEDFLQQLSMLKKMGPLKSLMKMIPGMGQIMKHADVQMSGDELKPIEAIIQSMTRAERKDPDLLSGRTGGSRRRRIAKGSGRDINEVNGLIKQFKAMKRMIEEMTRGGGLQQMMTAQGVQDMVPRMPGGRALEKKLREAGVSKGRGPRPKRKKNKRRRRR